MSASNELSSNQLSHKVDALVGLFLQHHYFSFYEFIQGNMFASINNEIIGSV